jgi:UDP-N-acetylmuramoyl-tripeptide--D-alanyl-D-alanine ligase
VLASDVENRGGMLRFRVDGVRVCIPVWGRHNLSCALAAFAVARLMDFSAAEIADALAGFQPPPLCCQVSEVGGVTIIDDSASAHATGTKAALELLRDFDAPGRRIVICGDLRDSSAPDRQDHRQLGERVVSVCGADLLVACGEHARDVVIGARDAGMPVRHAIACRQLSDAAGLLAAEVEPGDVVLVKGSRAVALEKIVEYLQAIPTRQAA